ncbi:helix-turn-helix domain-containing protein [Pasteurellaceae bacterium 20609_3]|uniref:RodZ domain-containing protein n=1 Tax=Spirabiliibacterium mucosae TaxID=28156 RepID=UPI001AAE0B97|nr:RodZ family helix-turn-helix domain-containing protein [Spirabiliibacterium mucosae]MBE2897506.1 helix-turn-helix domain-containing protein [Spirabiliibacterium mucosae]
MDNEQQHTPSSITLGQQFRQRREALGLTIEDVVQQTHLKTAVINHLENDEFIVPNYPPTFMRGYVQNYAKFLKIPKEQWQAAHISFGAPVENDLQKNLRNNNKVNHYSSYSGWVGRLTWIIVLIMIGMTGYWWWQNYYQQSQNERESLVENFLNQNDTQANQSNTTTLEPVVDNTPTQAEATVAPTTVDAPQAAIEPAVEPVSVEDKALEAPSNAAVQNDSAVDGNSVQGQTSGEVLSNAMEKLNGNAQSAVEQTDDAQASDTPAAASETSLSIEITGSSCWLSVKDANRKVLAQKEYKRGEVLNFDGSEAYSLVIGAPQNVKITFRGEEVPLKIDGRVARFKLPKN